MIVTEDLEDVEHRGACFILEQTLVANHRKQTIESGFELRPGGERLGKLDPQGLVLRFGCNPGFEVGEIMATRRLEAGGRLQAVDLGIGNEAAEHDERLLGLAAIDQE